MYGYECPDCGASLDPNEKCDCQATAETKKELAPVGAGRKHISKKQKTL